MASWHAAWSGNTIHNQHRQAVLWYNAHNSKKQDIVDDGNRMLLTAKRNAADIEKESAQ